MRTWKATTLILGLSLAIATLFVGVFLFGALGGRALTISSVEELFSILSVFLGVFLAYILPGLLAIVVIFLLVALFVLGAGAITFVALRRLSVVRLSLTQWLGGDSDGQLTVRGDKSFLFRHMIFTVSLGLFYYLFLIVYVVVIDYLVYSSTIIFLDGAGGVLWDAYPLVFLITVLPTFLTLSYFRNHWASSSSPVRPFLEWGVFLALLTAIFSLPVFGWSYI